MWRCNQRDRVLLARIPQITRILFFTKTTKTPDNVISLSDFFSASSDMVFICKHLRPYPLKPLHLPSSADDLVRQKHEKQCCYVLGYGGARKSPPPDPPRGMGVGMIALQIVFDVFAF